MVYRYNQNQWNFNKTKRDYTGKSNHWANKTDFLMDSKHKNELIRLTYKKFSDKIKTELSNEFKAKKPMDRNK